VRFPKFDVEALRNGSRNTRQARRQCGQNRPPEAENSAAAASIAGVAAAFESNESFVLLGFPHWHSVC
jgi:hypothetical protein